MVGKFEAGDWVRVDGTDPGDPEWFRPGMVGVVVGGYTPSRGEARVSFQLPRKWESGGASFQVDRLHVVSEPGTATEQRGDDL